MGPIPQSKKPYSMPENYVEIRSEEIVVKPNFIARYMLWWSKFFVPAAKIVVPIRTKVKTVAGDVVDKVLSRFTKLFIVILITLILASFIYFFIKQKAENYA